VRSVSCGIYIHVIRFALNDGFFEAKPSAGLRFRAGDPCKNPAAKYGERQSLKFAGQFMEKRDSIFSGANPAAATLPPALLLCSAYGPSGLLASQRFGSVKNRSDRALSNFFVATLETEADIRSAIVGQRGVER